MKFKNLKLIHIAVFVAAFSFPIFTTTLAVNVEEVKAIPVEIKPDAPVKISIPKISVGHTVKAMGLTKENKMAVPDNYIEVGWYSNNGIAPTPGNKGNAVMGAHVDSGGVNPKTRGVFKDLSKLVVGDDIYTTDKNGNVLHFKVTRTAIYPHDSRENLAVFGPTNEKNLNLITCHGNWVSKINTYDKRFIVFATLVV